MTAMRNKSNLDTLRHSCSHVMARAVKQLWPEVKLGIGPSIEDGFYYDFDRSQPFSQEDLALIEDRMKNIIAKNEPFIREEMTRSDAQKLFISLQEDYKVELVNALADERSPSIRQETILLIYVAAHT